jgi:hypothetical protein
MASSGFGAGDFSAGTSDPLAAAAAPAPVPAAVLVVRGASVAWLRLRSIIRCITRSCCGEERAESLRLSCLAAAPAGCGEKRRAAFSSRIEDAISSSPYVLLGAVSPAALPPARLEVSSSSLDWRLHLSQPGRPHKMRTTCYASSCVICDKFRT